MLIPPNKMIDLAEAAVRMDVTAINILFEYFRPSLFAQALRICGNTPIAQEAIQETFITAYHQLATLREASAIYSWLKKILINMCYRQLRKERSRLDKMHAILKDPHIHNSIEEHIENTANQQRLYQAMSRLSGELNSCILLRYFSDFTSYEDIATILGIPIGTVRSRLASARNKLSVIYHAHEDAGEQAITESRSWSAYYLDIWKHLYDDGTIRKEFYNHIHPLLDIRFTSGKTGQGRKLLEQEISEDLACGTRFEVKEIASAGSISIIQGINTFTPGFPNRCAPNSVFVLFRQNEKIGQLHIYDSPRPEERKKIF